MIDYIPFQISTTIGDDGSKAMVADGVEKNIPGSTYSFYLMSKGRWRRYDRVIANYDGANWAGKFLSWIEPQAGVLQSAIQIVDRLTDNANVHPIVGGQTFEGTVLYTGDQRSVIIPPNWRFVFDYTGAALPAGRKVGVNGVYWEGDTMAEVLFIGQRV